MVKRNPHLARLHAGYLFPEIQKRKRAFQAEYPHAKLISLGIGDTTQPIPSLIASKMSQYALDLSTSQGYFGYGPEQGNEALRLKLAKKMYANRIDSDEIFISDGSKCDIGRLQILFGPHVTIAVQDPSYPVYVDTGVIVGQTSHFDRDYSQYQGITYMRCHPDNHFFPNLSSIPKTDILYFCSPNNPTGAVASRSQLQELIAFCKANHTILVYDAAYACFIRDASIPKSIYEIEGADEIAIELGSFSKMAGFTGVRLGWSIIPKKICFEGGESLHSDWSRINSTFFNGASNIAQAGGLAALSDEGFSEIERLSDYYLLNAKKLRVVFKHCGYPVYGGDHAPYIWVQFPQFNSWQAFEWILENLHIITTPGIGFGPGGNGFIRLSTFGHAEDVDEALLRIQKVLT